MGKMSKVAAGMLCGALLLTGCAGGGNGTVQGGAYVPEPTASASPSENQQIICKYTNTPEERALLEFPETTEAFPYPSKYRVKEDLEDRKSVV